MFGNTTYYQHEYQPAARVVYGSTFDGAPYQITLEDESVGLGSSANIRKGYISAREPLVVAVKVFGELIGRAKEELLVRELHFARMVSMTHPCILRFIGTATIGEQTAIVSLYMKNGNLMQYIKTSPKCNKKMLILQVADAVEFLHVEKKLVHGDLKCENVLVSDFGNALLADFGLSSFIEKSERLSTTMTAIRAMNTVQFAAPELLGVTDEYDSPVSKRTTASDIYAFGMLILEAISEHPPWGKKTNLAVIASLSARQQPPRPTRDGTLVSMSHSWWDVCRSCWSFVSHERPEISNVLRILKTTESAPYRDLTVNEDIGCAAYMPDGRTIVAASTASVILIDSTLGHIRELWRDGPERPYSLLTPSLAVSPDGRHVACTLNETIRVLDVASGVLMTSLQHDGIVNCVNYSPDGTRIASGARGATRNSGSTVQLWDSSTGAVCGQATPGHTHEVCSVSFSPDGSCLASADYGGTIRLWDSKTCTLMAILERPGSASRLYTIKFLPDGMHIAAVYEEDMVVFLDVRASATVHYVWEQLDETGVVAISPSGRYIAAESVGGTIQIWDVQDGGQLGAPLIGSDECGDIASIAFSPDGRSIVLAKYVGPLRVWDLFD